MNILFRKWNHFTSNSITTGLGWKSCIKSVVLWLQSRTVPPCWMCSAVKENEHDHKWSFSSHYHVRNSCFTLRFGPFIAYYKKIYNPRLFYSVAAYNIGSSKNRDVGSNDRYTHTHRKHTAVCDIKSSSRHGVISLKLQPQRVGVGCQMGRTLSSREPPDDEGIIRLPILHR